MKKRFYSGKVILQMNKKTSVLLAGCDWHKMFRYDAGPTEEEIEQNRREMFCGFGEDVP